MSLSRRLGLAALLVTLAPLGTSQAGVWVGYGRPYYRPYYHRPYYGYGYGYGAAGFGLGLGLGLAATRPYPVYVAPAPVVVQQAPVVVQQPPLIAQPTYSPPPAPPADPLPPPRPVPYSAAPPAPELMPATATAANNAPANVDFYVQQLRGGDEQTRADALVRLGKLRDERAVGPMVKALNSDGSAKVREAAARGLGLIASPSSLAALQYAAQADDDREVRHSATFAAEIIRGNQRRN